jgi:hypothetical protein
MIFNINRVGSIEEDIREAKMDLDDAEMYLEKLKEFLEIGRYRKRDIIEYFQLFQAATDRFNEVFRILYRKILNHDPTGMAYAKQIGHLNGVIAALAAEIGQAFIAFDEDPIRGPQILYNKVTEGIEIIENIKRELNMLIGRRYQFL